MSASLGSITANGYDYVTANYINHISLNTIIVNGVTIKFPAGMSVNIINNEVTLTNSGNYDITYNVNSEYVQDQIKCTQQKN